MSILTNTEHYKNYITNADGNHVLTSYYTTADDVVMDETTGLTLDLTRQEMTQAEYDALVAAGTVLDDVEYYITDGDAAIASAVFITKATYDANKSYYDAYDGFVNITDIGNLSANQVAYDNTESGIVATTTQDAIDEISDSLGNVGLKKLWENPSPSSNFEQQTISLSSSDYDYLVIFFKYSISNPHTNGLHALKNNNTLLNMSVCGDQGVVCVSRNCVFDNDTTLNFKSGLFASGASKFSVDNSRCVPIRIYGGKFYN